MKLLVFLSPQAADPTLHQPGGQRDQQVPEGSGIHSSAFVAIGAGQDCTPPALLLLLLPCSNVSPPAAPEAAEAPAGATDERLLLGAQWLPGRPASSGRQGEGVGGQSQGRLPPLGTQVSRGRRGPSPHSFDWSCVSVCRQKTRSKMRSWFLLTGE